MKIKTLMVAVTITALATFSALARDTNSLFNSKEFSVTVGTAAGFQQDYSYNLNVGVGYFPSRYFGIEASAPLFQSEGVSFREINASLVARLPLGRFAPYAGFGGNVNWQDKQLNYLARLGTEFRVNSKIGLFAECQARNNSFSNVKDSSLAVNAGLKLIF